MKTLTLAALLCLPLHSEESKKPDPVVESLRAENELLRAQLTQMRVEFQHQMNVCMAQEVMQARVTANIAAAKADAAKKLAEPKPSK